MKRDSITLVLSTREDTELAWKNVFGRFGSVRKIDGVDSVLSLIEKHSASDLGRIDRIVFTDLTGAAEFLVMLSRLPIDYSGDLLWIRSNGSAFISSAVPGERGRVLYALERHDLGLYLEAHYPMVLESTDPIAVSAS